MAIPSASGMRVPDDSWWTTDMAGGPVVAGTTQAPSDRPHADDGQGFPCQCGEAGERPERIQALCVEARQALIIRDEVLAMISHELGTPVASMAMILERLLDRMPKHPDRQSERLYLETMNTSVIQMRRLVQGLIDVRRIEAGHFTVHRESQSLRDLIELALKEVAPLAEAHETRIEVDLPPPDVRVHADRHRVVQVLLNLVTNALRYGSRPDTGLVVRGRRIGEEVEVSVVDRGPGIPAGELSTLFDRFTRPDHLGKGGLGLGLKISREIVEAHGGRIAVRTAPGAGSTFYFTLPAEKSAGVPTWDAGEATEEGPSRVPREAAHPLVFALAAQGSFSSSRHRYPTSASRSSAGTVS